MPPVDSRSAANYVGLKNAGATCYMNSVLQQLYMSPSVPEAILSIEDDSIQEDRYHLFHNACSLCLKRSIYSLLSPDQCEHFVDKKTTFSHIIELRITIRVEAAW